MTKRAPRLADLAARATPPKATKTKAMKPGRASVPHYSLYISPIVVKEIRRLAIELDMRPHDLFLEGIDMMLKKRGQTSIAELTGAE